MKNKNLKKFLLKSFQVFLIIFLLNNLSCSVYQTLTNISRLKFQLGNVSGFSLSGVDLTNKKKLSDFTAVELLKISSSFASGKLPVSFVLNVKANNPNDGTGGYPKTNATLKEFPWRLLIDNKETISGNIASPISVPGAGQETIIPLTIGMDFMQFFKDKSYDSIINLALNIGGYSGSSSNLSLYARPVVSTSIGNISYPDEIKIVDFQYTK